MATTDQPKRRRKASVQVDLNRLDEILSRAEQRETGLSDVLKSVQEKLVELGKNGAMLQVTVDRMEKTIEESKQREADLVKRVSKLENLCMYIYAVGTVLVAVGMLTTWAINTGRFLTTTDRNDDKNYPQEVFYYAPLDKKHHGPHEVNNETK